jgi:hypothetical protein
LAYYLAGTGFFLIARVIFFPTDFMLVAPWKFGIGAALLLIAGAIGTPKALAMVMGPYAASILLGFISLLNLLQNSRAIFGIGLLSALYAALATWISSRQAIAKALTPSMFASLVVMGVIVVQIMISAYGVIAENGFLGQDAQDKYEIQTSGDLNLLLGGRAESLAAVQAIADSPILGHGSWARNQYYVRLYFDRLAEYDMITPGDMAQFYNASGDLIPSHSHLLGSWVEAGFLGALIWLWVLFLAFRALYGVLKVQKAPSLIVIVSAMFVFWDVLFSPFGADARFIRAAELAILLLLVNALDRQRRPVRTPSSQHAESGPPRFPLIQRRGGTPAPS